MQPLDEHRARLHDAIAVGIAQERDAIGARWRGAGPLHEQLHRPAPHAAAAVGAGRRIGLGHQHVAVRQDIDPARMIQPVGEQGDAHALRRDRRSALRPTHGRSDIHGRDEGLVGRRQHGVRADARRHRQRARSQAPGRARQDHISNIGLLQRPHGTGGRDATVSSGLEAPLRSRRRSAARLA